MVEVSVFNIEQIVINKTKRIGNKRELGYITTIELYAIEAPVLKIDCYHDKPLKRKKK